MKYNLNNQRGGATPLISVIICIGVLVVGGIVLSILGGLKRDEVSPSAGDINTARPHAPGFALRNLAGKEVKLSDYRGKTVLINFWATWCGPCVMEVPSFVKLRTLYHDRGLEIIGISLDGKETEAVANFVKRFKINYPIVMGTNETVEAYGPMNGIPVTIVIDREGRIHSRHIGMMSFEKMEEAVKPLL